MFDVTFLARDRHWDGTGRAGKKKDHRERRGIDGIRDGNQAIRQTDPHESGFHAEEHIMCFRHKQENLTGNL